MYERFARVVDNSKYAEDDYELESAEWSQADYESLSFDPQDEGLTFRDMDMRR